MAEADELGVPIVAEPVTATSLHGPIKVLRTPSRERPLRGPARGVPPAGGSARGARERGRSGGREDPAGGKILTVARADGEVVRAPIDARHEALWRRVVDAEGAFTAAELAAAAEVPPAVVAALLFELVRLGGLEIGAPLPVRA
ncbi:MAG TPA: hypothetical protein VIK91_27155 [Nannocystis sp.]